jgi:hypothetical protein
MPAQAASRSATVVVRDCPLRIVPEFELLILMRASG